MEKPKPRGEVYEGIAFQFCKIATVALIAGRFALPVAAGLCAVFYVLAWSNGKRDTRCVMKYPLLIALFWAIVATISLAYLLRLPVIANLFPQKTRSLQNDDSVPLHREAMCSRGAAPPRGRS